MNTPIYNKLLQLEQEKRIPFHMPGHKRKASGLFFGVEKMDITEIEGYDNLHQPEGIIRESMDGMREIWGSRESWYLVGGSTLGILASISAVCERGDKILIARNCHKAVYNSIRLLQLEAIYCYPEISEEYDIYRDVRPEEVERVLEENEGVKAVVITSPTYEGVVSDIVGIKKILEEYHIPLIVDEAHGAHLIFHDFFPKSAVQCGADLVIQSTHKTLPAFTQSAVLHLGGDAIRGIDPEQVEDMLSIYETSSPSYLLMAAAECGIAYMHENRDKVQAYVDNLQKFRAKCGQLKNITLVDREKLGCHAYDAGKLVFSVKESALDGRTLFLELFERYHIELEMENLTYVVAMTSVCDAEEDYESLWRALRKIDRKISGENADKKRHPIPLSSPKIHPEKILASWECRQYHSEKIPLTMAAGKIAAQQVMVYPPGIPLLVPGEKITKEMVENIAFYLHCGYNVVGVKYASGVNYGIRVLTEKKSKE